MDVDTVADPRGETLVTRVARLVSGLLVFAMGLVLMVRAQLGLSSWDVLHDAVASLTPLTFGHAVVAISVLVVVGSFVLGVKPGPGTIANMILIGIFTDLLLRTGVLADLDSWALPYRIGALVAGVGGIALGTALYISARLGAGPRDSLMLAVATAIKRSPGTARAIIEVTVLVIGVALGGSVGLGTIVFAVLIGPAVDGAFRLLPLEHR